MYSRIVNSTLKGGALYYVIFVVFVITSVISMLLMHRGLKIRQVREEICYFEKLDDLNSGLSVYFAQPELYQETAESDICLFDDSTRVVNIRREAHGLIDLLTATVVYHGKPVKKMLLTGMDPFRGDSVVLYVPDRRQALYASGSTAVNGNAYLPAKGMQRASIEGRPLQRGMPVVGRIYNSGSTLPHLASWILQKIQMVQDMDSLDLVSKGIGQLTTASIENPYTDEPLWYSSDEDYQISGISAKGRIGFLSRGTIYIRSDARLEGTVVSADKIVVEDGFVGIVQLFARDSLVIGKHCEFRFPSVACLANDNVNPIFMEVGESTTFHGTIVSYQPNLSTQAPFLRIKRGVMISGEVYHPGKVELLGGIHGSLYCEDFYLKTDRAYYENHLLDNQIDFLLLPPHFVSIDLFTGYNNQIIDVIEIDI